MSFKHSDIDNIIAWISGQALTTGVLSFSVDLLKAFLLGLVGGLGGYLAKRAVDYIKNERR